MQSKDEMKRSGIKSPDVADAFLLTFAVTPVMRQRFAMRIVATDTAGMSRRAIRGASSEED